MKLLIHIAIAASFASLLGIVVPLALANSGSEAPLPGTANTDTDTCAEEANPTIDTVELTVTGMVSDACPAVLELALGQVPGIVSVEASFASSSASVSFDRSAITAEQVAAAVQHRTGFQASVSSGASGSAHAAFRAAATCPADAGP